MFENLSSTPSLVSSLLNLLSTLNEKPGLHFGKHLVEVIPINFDELTVFDCEQRFVWLPRKIGEHANNERQLLLFDGSAGFNVIGNLDARRTAPALFSSAGFLLACCNSQGGQRVGAQEVTNLAGMVAQVLRQ